MRKKILILDTGKEWGGGTNSLLELLKRADRNRYEFSALFYNNYRMGASSDIKTELEKTGTRFIPFETAGRKLFIKPLKEIGRAALFFSRELRKRFVFHADYIGRVLPDSRRIAKVIKDGGFDMLYMNNQPSSNLEGILAAGYLGLPCVQHSRIEVSLNDVEAKAVNRHVSKVICVSKGVKDALVESGVEEGGCVVVYNGIDKDARPARDALEVRSSLGIGADAFLVGTAGSLIKRKRIGLLIDALAALRGAVRCLIVGDGPDMARLKEKARMLGIGEMAVFAGFSSDALSLINAMDVFVLPSEKEGFPRVILEAMLMAKPVVAFPVSGAREMIVDGRTGLILKKETPEAITAALKELMVDRARLGRMGEAGRKRVISEFGMDRYVACVTAVFDEVLR